MTDSTMSSTTTAAAEKRAPRASLVHPDHATRTPARDTTAADARPVMEPWVKPLLAALVPAIAAFFVPHTIKLALFAVSGLLFVAGLVLMVRQERGHGARD